MKEALWKIGNHIQYNDTYYESIMYIEERISTFATLSKESNISDMSIGVLALICSF